MSEPDDAERGFRERLGAQGEDTVGEIADILLGNPVFKEALKVAAGARERAVEAQHSAMEALNLPSSADIDRLARRVRSLSERLEGIEDGMDRLEDTIERLRKQLDTEPVPD
jgi:predicted RNase H-like nuclease (RuvC/YqgF family)